MIPTKAYQNAYDIITDAMCEYMEGPGMKECAESLYGTLTASTKREKTKELRSKLKEAFHIEGTKYPSWVQGAEWPMGKNSPMVYLSRKKDGNRVVFLFRDADTGEEREIEQFD